MRENINVLVADDLLSAIKHIAQEQRWSKSQALRQLTLYALWMRDNEPESWDNYLKQGSKQ